MPALLSRKAASALDSMPRSSNVKRSPSALYRLQQGKQAPNHSLESRLPFVRKNFTALRHRNSGKGLSSADLPPASSDLQSDEIATSPVLLQGGRITFGDDNDLDSISEDEDEKEKTNRLFSGSRFNSFSPSKANRLSKIIADFVEADIRPSSPSPASPRLVIARKRVVHTSMISDPSNFQHTGHSGLSSYKSMQNGEQAAQLAKQLMEVTNALKMEDNEGVTVVVDYTPSQPSSISDASSASSISRKSSSGELEQKGAVSLTASTGSVAEEARNDSLSGSQPSSPSLVETKAAFTRQASKRKPVPKMLELDDLCNMSKDQVLEEKEPPSQYTTPATEVVSLPEVSLPSEIADEDQSFEATEVKRLVQGPGGGLITDTANGRWNYAMDEIKKALKADGEDIDAEVEETLVDGLRRADETLTRLNAM